MAKATHGGKREGAGRKKGAELKKVTIWVDKDALEEAKEKLGKELKLSERVTELIKKLLK